MEQPTNSHENEASATRKAGQRFIERLYSYHPDNEMLARMWETDPETMTRLMPEVGTDAFEVPKVPKWRVLAGIALNNVRLSFGQWPKETRSPEKRMYDAWRDFQDDGQDDDSDEDAYFQEVSALIWNNAHEVVKEERETRRRNYLDSLRNDP